jgi:AraC-like DNA-binding protein
LPVGGADGVAADGVAAAIAAFIATHFREPLQLADIAEVVHLHPSTAGTAFRRSTGVTPSQYLTQCRVAESQRLLIATNLTTTDIALRSGFGSTSRFYAAFTEHCQMAPAVYRRALRRPGLQSFT